MRELRCLLLVSCLVPLAAVPSAAFQFQSPIRRSLVPVAGESRPPSPQGVGGTRSCLDRSRVPAGSRESSSRPKKRNGATIKRLLAPVATCLPCILRPASAKAFTFGDAVTLNHVTGLDVLPSGSPGSLIYAIALYDKSLAILAPIVRGGALVARAMAFVAFTLLVSWGIVRLARHGIVSLVDAIRKESSRHGKRMDWGEYSKKLLEITNETTKEWASAKEELRELERKVKLYKESVSEALLFEDRVGANWDVSF